LVGSLNPIFLAQIIELLFAIAEMVMSVVFGVVGLDVPPDYDVDGFNIPLFGAPILSLVLLIDFCAVELNNGFSHDLGRLTNGTPSLISFLTENRDHNALSSKLFGCQQDVG